MRIEKWLNPPKKKAQFRLNQYKNSFTEKNFYRIACKTGWFGWHEIEGIMNDYWVTSINFDSINEAQEFLIEHGYKQELFIA